MTALITGAARGIGAAIAGAFADAGYSVAINCRNEASAKGAGSDVAQSCRDLGAEAECFAADVSDYGQCESMVKAVIERFGEVDVLVNNAGVTRDSLIARMSADDFDYVISSNLKSAFNMTKLAGTLMMRKRSGWIINISSVVGVNGNAGQANYAASKAGIIGLTKSAAKELGPRGVICNAIAPGFIESAMTDSLSDEVRDKIFDSITLRRFGKPEDVAKTAVFLAGQSYITGQVIIVDGGMRM